MSHRNISRPIVNHDNPFSDAQQADNASISSDSSVEETNRNVFQNRRPAPRPPVVQQSYVQQQHDQIIAAPQPVHISEKSRANAPTTQNVAPFSKEKMTEPSAIPVEKPKLSLWARFVREYQKNYCPHEQPELIMPTAPDDKEKYSYIRMNRIPIIVCGCLSTLALTAGAWLFVKASWYYFWFAFYAALSEFYIFTSFGITIMGKQFDLKEHNKIVESHPLNEETAPTVDIFLPVCKEPLEILDNTWKHIAELKYVPGKMQVFVLDDGAQQEVKDLTERYGFTYMCRDNRPELKKAGNMRHAFAKCSGDFFVVYDADFCPRADFLLELIPRHMEDPKIAILQTPQYFRSSGNQTWMEQGAGSVQEYFYRLVQQCRDRWGGAICVGSNAVYRRAALEAVGGTAPAECSEDVHTGFYAVTRGWKVKYMPLVLACGVCPDIPRAFFSQQMRWCTGSLSLLTHRDFWKSSLTWQQKFCYLTGFFYYSTTAVAAFLNPLPAPILLWTRPDLFKYYNLFFAFPSIILGLITIRIWARSRYTLSVQYSQVIMSYAYLHAIYDRFFGTKMTWLPSGDGKAHKNNRYRNMRTLCWCWTITHNGLLISACVYRGMQGLAPYQFIPALVLDAFNLLCVHRFLLYRHSKME